MYKLNNRIMMNFQVKMQTDKRVIVASGILFSAERIFSKHLHII